MTLGKKLSIYSLYLYHLVRIIADCAAEILMCLITVGLPKTPLGMLHNIRYIHGITFLKFETVPKQLWSQDFQIKDLNVRL